jgi:hypothetical protein
VVLFPWFMYAASDAGLLFSPTWRWVLHALLFAELLMPHAVSKSVCVVFYACPVYRNPGKYIRRCCLKYEYIVSADLNSLFVGIVGWPDSFTAHLSLFEASE